MALGATKRLKRLKSSSSMTFGIHPVCSNNNSSGNNSSNNNSNNSCHNNSNSSFFLIILLMINIIIVFWIGIDGCCCCWRPPTSHLPLPTPHLPALPNEMNEWRMKQEMAPLLRLNIDQLPTGVRHGFIASRSRRKWRASLFFFLNSFIHSFFYLGGRCRMWFQRRPLDGSRAGVDEIKQRQWSLLLPPSLLLSGYQMTNQIKEQEERKRNKKKKRIWWSRWKWWWIHQVFTASIIAPYWRRSIDECFRFICWFDPIQFPVPPSPTSSAFFLPPPPTPTYTHIYI